MSDEKQPEVAVPARLEQRPLGVVHVASVVVGAIVGVGIFFTPASLARALPTPAWVLGIWLLGGVVSVAGAFVFADLGARHPQAGGVYVFLREGFGTRAGPPLAFLYGWMQLLVIQPGSMAVIALVLVDHVAFLTKPFPDWLRTGGAVLAIATFTAANLLGLKTGGRIQVGAAAMKLGALALLIAIGIGWGHAANLTTPSSTPVAGHWTSWLVLGLIPVLFSFGGAYHATYIAGSVRNPEKSVPRGIVAGIAVVLVGYLGANVAYLGLLGHDGLAKSSSPAAEATALALGPFAGKAIAAIIVLSASGILNTICLGFPFVIYAMAKDGLFFRAAGKLRPRTGRPAVAVALQGLFACLALVLGSSRIDKLLTGIAFGDALFQGAVAVVVLISPGGTSPRRLVAAITFLVLELGLAIGCLVNTPRESAFGAVALVVGAAVAFAWTSLHAKKKRAGPAKV